MSSWDRRHKSSSETQQQRDASAEGAEWCSGCVGEVNWGRSPIGDVRGTSLEWTDRSRGNAALPFTAASCEVTHSHIPLPLPCLLHDGLHPASNASQNKPCLMLLLVRHFITMRKVTKTWWEHMTVSEIVVETHINQTPRDDYLSPRNTSKHFSMHNNITYHIKTYKTKKIIKQNNHFARKYVWPFPP